MLKVLISIKRYINLWVCFVLMKLLGAAKVTIGRKIALISDVSKKLDANEGDVIGFYENENGEIIIKKG